MWQHLLQLSKGKPDITSKSKHLSFNRFVNKFCRMSRSFRPNNCARVVHKVREILAPTEGERYMINRNPRNLEKLRIAYKPSGYHLEKPGRSFWHKLELNVSGKYVKADVRHFENGPVLSASTSEWAIKKQLYQTKDTTAFTNLARVLAQRCVRAGITEVSCNIEAVPNGKVDKFLKTMEENGVTLQEPERYKTPHPWDAYRQEKYWETTE